MIQEVLILRTVVLVTVDEAFDEPEKKEIVKERKSIKYAKCSCKSLTTSNNYKATDEHLRINSAACRRLLALLRAFIPRHADWITITKHT